MIFFCLFLGSFVLSVWCIFPFQPLSFCPTGKRRWTLEEMWDASSNTTSLNKTPVCVYATYLVRPLSKNKHSYDDSMEQAFFNWAHCEMDNSLRILTSTVQQEVATEFPINHSMHSVGVTWAYKLFIYTF